MAQPTRKKFTPRLQEIYLEEVRISGLLGRSAEAISLDLILVNNYRKGNPAYEKRVQAALDLHDEDVELEIKRRGSDGYRKPIFYKGEEVGHVREFSDKLLELYAKRRMKQYRDKQQLEVDFKGGVLAVPGLAKDSKTWEEQNRGSKGNR